MCCFFALEFVAQITTCWVRRARVSVVALELHVAVVALKLHVAVVAPELVCNHTRLGLSGGATGFATHALCGLRALRFGPVNALATLQLTCRSAR